MGIIGIALYRILDLIVFLILVQCIMTWIPGARDTKLFDMLSMITDPIEDPIRSVIYRYTNSPIDFTPIIALFLIRFAQRAILVIFW